MKHQARFIHAALAMVLCLGASVPRIVQGTDLPARKIAEEAMKIAGKICIYTNDSFTIEELSSDKQKGAAPAQ